MQLRSADEGSTIFYKVRALRALLLERGKKKKNIGNVDRADWGVSWLFCSVSTVEIKHPPTTSPTSLQLFLAHVNVSCQLKNVWPDFRN